ncbi:MAG: hypothetical protein ACHQJ6_06005 [Candidatus Berkiellales bacterium]
MDGINVWKDPISDLIVFQRDLIKLASSHFMYQLSFHWWCNNLAELSPLKLFEQWMKALEEAYGTLLAEPLIQQAIGKWMNKAILEYHHAATRL